MEMENKKKKLTQSRTIQIMVSLILAIVCWFFVAFTDTSIRSQTIDKVPLNISILEESLSELGLSIIEVDASDVSAEISGELSKIVTVSPEEVAATLSIPKNFTEAGTYNLTVVSASSNNGSSQNKDFKVDKYLPAQITVKLDRIQTKVFPVTLKMNGAINVSDGYIQEKSPIITPPQITLSGPGLELSKIGSVVLSMDSIDELKKNYASEHTLTALDPQGNPVDLKSHHLTIDHDKAQVVIPVLKKKTIPLSVEFLNVPRNFPIEELQYAMSNETIEVAAPAELLDKYDEIVLGYIDISKLDKDKYVYNFEVELPKNFTNINNIFSINVRFHNVNWSETTFDLSDIKIINQPEDYELNLITSQIMNVKMIGSKEEIESLTKDDIVVELDLAEKKDITVGQYQYPVKISAPTKGLVWASGEYTVIIQVAKLENEEQAN